MSDLFERAALPDGGRSNPARPLRILFFHPLTGRLWRGIERTVISLASALADQRHDVHVLTLRHTERALLDGLHSRVRLWEVPRSKYFAFNLAVPFFLPHLLVRRYDAVVVFFGGFGIGPTVVAAQHVRHIPVFLCPCYPVEIAPHRYDEIDRWRLAQTAAGIWAAGEHVAEQTRQRFGRPVMALPQGVDAHVFRPDDQKRYEVRARLHIPMDAPVLLTVAALTERKGIHHVINAIHLLRLRFPTIRYLVAGDGEYRGELAGQIQTLGLQRSVLVLKAYDHVEELYQSADLFCLLAYGEANPMVIYEALAAGLPLLTLQCPPFPDVLNDEVATLLPDTDPARVAEAIGDLLADPARRLNMSTTGRQLACERFSFQSLAGLVTDLVMARESPMDGETVEYPQTT
jgi:glycosyltransferase involved in cell wall biosynthesis